MDASATIGTGHLRRCMLIGDGLRSHLGWEPIYCYRHHHDSLVSPAVLGDRRAVLLPTPKFEISEGETTWLGSDVYSDARETMSLAKELGCESIVVDHYGASLDWQKLVIGQCGPLIVIDDYSDRDYAADIVINWCVEELRKEQTEATALSLVGHKYVPIRDEFVTVRKHVVARNPSAVVPRNLLICFGGVDRQNVTLRALMSVVQHFQSLRTIKVVVGSGYSEDNMRALQNVAKQFDGQVLISRDSQNIAQEMGSVDFCIGAGGMMAWERCCLGLPSATIVIAENQRLICDQLLAAGATFTIEIDQLDRGLKELYCQIINCPELLANMRRRALPLVDGNGIQRLVHSIAKSLGEKGK